MARPRFDTVFDLPDANRALAVAIGRKFGCRPKDLTEALRRAKRTLPKALVSELREAVDMEAWLGHPQWHRQINLGQMQDLHARAYRCLEGVNLKRDRERYWLGIATSLTVNLVVLAVLVCVVLRWRGLI